MLNNKKIIVVMPAYNAEKTFRKTFNAIPHEIVDEVIVVDDKSSDRTVDLAREMGAKIFVHDENKGYGANQKTCYKQALAFGADVVIMLHPDYQYNPRLIPAIGSLIAEEVYDVVLGSRILGNRALKGGMPIYKYIANRLLTVFENFLINEKLSEYHTGYRAFSRKVLETLPLGENSNDFVFDNQMLLQAFYFNFKVGEVSCPTRYETDSSSISFFRSTKYGLGVCWTAMQFVVAKLGIYKTTIFKAKGKRLHEAENFAGKGEQINLHN